jgi:hypothetical protein
VALAGKAVASVCDRGAGESGDLLHLLLATANESLAVC